MAYRLDPDEGVRTALRRCAREQLDHAIKDLSEGIEHDPVAAVHSARKAVKKERALLRLTRGTLPRRQRVRENATLRDAARELSGAREAEVNIQTLNELAERYTGQLPESTFDAFREPLEREQALERELLVRSALSSEAVQELGAVSVRIDDWTFKRGGWEALEPGLSRIYRRGRKAFRRARTKPSVENLHEWRKRVKDDWYALRLLASTGGPSVRGQAKEAHRLADLLGDDHDLGVLRQTLVRLSGQVAVDTDPLLALLQRRRDELQTEAFFVGSRLYAEKPKAFERRIQRCWKAGRAATHAAEERRPSELAAIG